MTTTDKLLRAADEYEMLPEGSRVLCALSGGADSVAMTLSLLESAEKRRITVFAAHLNHCLRGEESDRDEAFTRDFCASYGVQFFSERADVASFSAEHGLGLEEAARTIRYDFLNRTADRFGCDRIATAHTKNDNAETLLLNLVRGAGLDGLCGIPPIRGRIIRPLLMAERKDVECFLLEHGQAYVIDSTNADIAYSRNMIRHRILPELEKLNPKAVETLAGTAVLLRADADCLNAGLLDRIVVSGKSARINLKTLEGEPDAVKSRVFREACRTVGGILPSRRQTEALLLLANSKNPSCAQNLAGRLLARREYTAIIIEYCADQQKPEPLFLQLGENQFGVWKLSAEYVERRPIKPEPNAIYLKPIPVERLLVRARREGDTLTAAGRGWTKTLKKLFIERKVPKSERELTPVLEIDGKPATVPFNLPFRPECATDFAAEDGPALRIVFEYDRHKFQINNISSHGGNNGEEGY
jgi:tRNA(Ile)-lysidine synthase